jgi:hypothetical protein
MKTTLHASVALVFDVSYGICLSLLYGIMAAGQLLGFLGLYRPGPAVLLSLILAVLAGFLYFRENPRSAAEEHNPPSWLQVLLAGAALLVVVVLVAAPLLNWPAAPIGRELTWDAGAYHFPKAVELYRSGSAWDLSVAYGDYPFGYESLLAFGLTLTGDERLFGGLHLLIALFFWLSVWKLARRYSGLPSGLLLFASAALLVVGILPAGRGLLLGGGMHIEDARTWLLSGYALTVGKNDFLLGAALLAVILHSPVGPRRRSHPQEDAGVSAPVLADGPPQGDFAPLALGMAAMLAIATKPNALGVVGPIGLYVLWTVWSRQRSRPGLAGSHAGQQVVRLAAAALLALPGLLWAVRNLAVLGVVFTPAASALAADSIFNNLGNPFLYARNLPFVMLVGVLLVTLAALGLQATRLLPSLSPSLALMQALLFLNFIVTPATAFHRLRDVPSHIAWRFGVALLAYTFLVALTAVAPLLLRVPQTRFIRRTALGAAALLTAMMLVLGSWITTREPENTWILHDQFDKPVGVHGYYSAYDYAHQNIRRSVIHVENGLAYLLYGPGYTNTPTKLQYPLEMADRVPQPTPDYFVIFRPDWQAQDGSGNFPTALDSPEWQGKWLLVYNDGEGRVYQKITP